MRLDYRGKAEILEEKFLSFTIGLMMYEKLYSYDNLIAAYKKARKGKTKKPYVIAFEENLELNLLKLQEELKTQTYQPKPLKTFIIHEPKTRTISKSKFRDRIVQHALINIIGPIFEPTFIYDSFANQIGKGTLKAIERFDYFKRKVSKNNTRPCYVLKADIKHYFEEVNHEILLKILREKISDEKIMWLIDQILSNSSKMGGGGHRLQGMRMGTYTKKWFPNI